MRFWKRYRLQRSHLTPLRMQESALMSHVHGRSFQRRWTQSEFENLFASPAVFALGIKLGGELLAFVLMRVAADEAEVLTLATDKSWRRLGLGEKLLAHAFAQSAARGANKIYLEVESSNKGAIHLYQKLGFVETGRRKSYYESGGDALLMARAI